MHKHYLVLYLLAASLPVWVPGAAAAQNGPRFELIETRPDNRTDSGFAVTTTSVTQTLPGTCIVRANWSAPPSVIDANGFTVSFSVSVQGLNGRVYAAAVVGPTGFQVEPDHKGIGKKIGAMAAAEALAEPKQSASSSDQVRVTPPRSATDGQIIEFRMGVAYGPGVTWRYRAIASGSTAVTGNNGNTGTGTTTDRQLAARLDCPPSIVISALPSVNCHVLISGWRRNTADPVEVILPDAIDTVGNHGNGIQVIGRGSENVFNWDEPTHSWGLFVFACPAQRNTGAQCFNSVTTPGVKTINIIVRQKDSVVRVPLVITGVARGGVTSNRNPSLGCFRDTAAFDLNGFLTRSQANTIEGCVETCQSRGFAYAGVQYGESCLCGNSYGKYGESNNCNMKCTGNAGEICGGINANNVFATGVATAGANATQLSATLECPKSIVISALPSLNCHIEISGWRRNTADPVDVILPDAIDTFGNHANGIQVIGRGSENIFNWDGPTHSWGLFVFACPSQRNTGANCYNSVATPGPKTVNIIVRQRDVSVRVPLTLNAIGRAGAGAPAAAQLLGCFKDTSSYDLNGYLARSQANTVEGCVQTCQARGFAYAGVQYGQSCLCGNSYGKYGPADNCNMRCTGNPQETCGGVNANDVYTTGAGRR